jgi:hypothetical protein
MCAKRLVAALLTTLVACSFAHSGYAAMKSTTVTRNLLAGPYKLAFFVGPPETMSMNGPGAEKMMGGQNATCKMPGMHSMTMGSGTCNHHVELHVRSARSGKVLTNVHVVIRMTNMKTHMTINVPIMMMEGMHMGSSDFHYGNNVYAAAGMYSVHLQVNTTGASFSINLM